MLRDDRILLRIITRIAVLFKTGKQIRIPADDGQREIILAINVKNAYNNTLVWRSIARPNKNGFRPGLDCIRECIK